MFRISALIRLYWWQDKSYPFDKISNFLCRLILLTGIILLFSPEKNMESLSLIALFCAYLLSDSIMMLCGRCESDLRLGIVRVMLLLNPIYIIIANMIYAFIINIISFFITVSIIKIFLGGRLLLAPLSPLILFVTFFLISIQTVILCLLFYGINLKYKRIGAIVALIYPLVIFYSSLIEPWHTEFAYNIFYQIHRTLQEEIFQPKEIILSLISQFLLALYVFRWGQKYWKNKDL